MSLYQLLGEINKIKRKELVLPIARKEVVVYPLSVGDDISLKTAIVSPVKMDAELMRLLWTHTEFWRSADEIAANSDLTPKSATKKKELEEKGGIYYRPKENEFYSNISYFDKLVLEWGVFLVTYGTLGKRKITCDECKNEFEVDMDIDDTWQEDSVKIFEEEVPFTKFEIPITIPYNNDFNIEFTTHIPSMADYNKLMRMVPVSELQSNLESISTQFNLEEMMTLYTKKLAIYPKAEPDKKEESKDSPKFYLHLKITLTLKLVKNS